MTDQTTIRDRIAEALHGDQTPPPVTPWAEEQPLDREFFLRRADAVMTVLRGLTLRELELLYRPNTAPSRPEPRRLAAEAGQDEVWAVKDSTRRYAEELRATPGQASADGHTGWECGAGASLLVSASTAGPGVLGTHHGTIYACARHRTAAVDRITGCGYEADPQPAPPGHRWNPWPCGHVTTHGTQALAALTAAGTGRRTVAEQTPPSLEEQLDAAYRERAHLIALLAAMTPKAVITPAEDVDEPGWQIVYLLIGGRQASWHIAPRDADLFEHVKHVDSMDPLTIWDGHTTEQKYDRIRDHIAHRWFTPPAKYVRSDGVQTCPHTVHVGPDSCWECRDLQYPVRPVVG